LYSGKADTSKTNRTVSTFWLTLILLTTAPGAAQPELWRSSIIKAVTRRDIFNRRGLNMEPHTPYDENQADRYMQRSQAIEPGL
jgi:hypothetical protein